jgi:hypothetical protein
VPRSLCASIIAGNNPKQHAIFAKRICFNLRLQPERQIGSAVIGDAIKGHSQRQ